MKLENINFRKWLSLFALIAFGCFIAYLLRDFLTPFLGAIIFYVLFRTAMDKLTHERNWSPALAASMLILASFVIILIPVLILSYLLYEKLSMALNNPDSVIAMLNMFNEQSKSLIGFDLLSNQNIETLKHEAGNLIPSFINESAWIVGNIGIMYFVMYYLLVNHKEISYEVNKVLPLDKPNIGLLNEELHSMTISNIIGVPAVAIIQGAAAGLGYWLFGVSDPVFWAVITAFTSILPLIGTTLVWIPAGIFLIATGATMPGIGLLVYGGLVVINIDNIVRMFIQKRFANVHPVITVFGVIIGLNIFGLPGLIFGPLMLSYFVLLNRMYRKVYGKVMVD
jgi:predicted PurR-regulated permease PerM